MKQLQINFNTLLTMLSINVSDLSRFLNYDSSYLSRIRNGLRQPANPEEFAYYQKRAKRLLSKASPLMEVYRQDREREYNTFLRSDSQAEIRNHVAIQRKMADEILQHGSITEEIPSLTEDEFKQYPITMPLSEMFYEKDILYSWDDYMEHLKQTKEYAKQHTNYMAVENHSPAFKNIQIHILFLHSFLYSFHILYSINSYIFIIIYYIILLSIIYKKGC